MAHEADAQLHGQNPVNFSQALELHRRGRLAEAERICREVLQQQPNHFDALHLLGVLALQAGQAERAVELIKKAIALKPDRAQAYNNLGKALHYLALPEESLASCNQAIALKPDLAQAYYNRGNALFDLKRFEEALASYDRAIALNPDYAEAYGNQSFCLLLLGNFEKGWRQYEWRKNRDKPIAARVYREPLWLGEENIAGKTVLLWSEQGFGDTIQFCRYAKLAEARGANVILSVWEPLRELLKQISPTIQIISEDDVPTDFDYHCPIMSLPLAFRTTLETIPANIPYLKSSVEKSLFWKGKLAKESKLKVGLVWSGGIKPNQPKLWSVNKRRNIALAKFAGLKHPDIDFYSLQKGQPAESELGDLISQHWDGPQILDFTSLLNDFSDTAALIDNLDLVISVDTSTAHLAGAMGKPVWILNRFDTCWRWLLDRTDSPWYPTARLYRQEKAGDWDSVVQRVKTDLFKLAARGSA